MRPAAPLLRCLLVSLLLASAAAGGHRQKGRGIVWGREAQKAIAAAAKAGGAGAGAAGVSVAAAVGGLAGPEDLDLGYLPEKQLALYACSGIAADGSTHVHSHSTLPHSRRALLAGSALPGGADPTDPARAFKLHSRPGAPRFLLLDFTGHYTANSVWNEYYTGFQPFTTPPYDIDGNPKSFSNLERANIIAIWRAVAEDYAPFDVDVTTEETDSLGRPLNLQGRGARVVIGGSSLSWFGSKAGGVAWLNSFGKPYTQPAFVFPAQLANASTKHIWEAASHELGHTFGLSHDGNSTYPYYYGQGIWAPIMGASYNRELTQWDRGEYADSNNKEDDLARIARVLGYRPDDHANDRAAATRIPCPGVLTRGIIGRTNDQDWFFFFAGKGTARLVLSPVPDWRTRWRANLDARMELWRSWNARAPLARWNWQGGLLRGPRSVSLPFSGKYYVLVTDAGEGNPLVTGYSSYGSLGEYSLRVDHPTAPKAFKQPPCPPPPPLRRPPPPASLRRPPPPKRR